MHDTLETAKLIWRNANTPVSSGFDDIYFSAEDGFAESQFVYLSHNQLNQRFSSLSRSHFTVAETGFGTGLNFLLTWQLWNSFSHCNKKLYFISTERFPLHKDDLIKSLACWPSLSELSKELCDNYPLSLSGIHTIELSNNVTLILGFGNASDSLNSLIENPHPLLSCASFRAVDAWFLDGFAPDKNPEMWSPELFTAVAKLSHRKTTFSSFTAAGIVRRGLQSVGFEVEKVKGFGKKRDMIKGCFLGLPTLASDCDISTRARHYGDFWPIYRSSTSTTTAIVIGAGIAGATSAFYLANAGIKVTLIESHPEAFEGASGNPQAMLFPKFSFENGIFSQFNLTTYLYALRFYQQFTPNAFFKTGMLQTINDAEKLHAQKTCARFELFDSLIQYVDAKKASEIANTFIKDDCLYFSSTGWIRPKSLMDDLIRHENITFIPNTMIKSIKHHDKQWHAIDHNEARFSADIVVLCNANAALDLLPKNALKTKNIRGQISQFHSSSNINLNSIVCSDGYISPKDPINHDEYTCGASYDLHSQEKRLLETSHQQNLQQTNTALPQFDLDISRIPLKGRVGFRCTTNDYLPIVGPIPEQDSFLNDYAFYNKSRKAHIPIIGSFHEGLFVNIAHGSRGFSTAPLCAALIRAYALEQAWPMPMALITALHPGRFVIKDIAQRKKTASSAHQ